MSTPWYKVVSPRAEVRTGRSFHPDEFAIALEQVVAGTAPVDYTDPVKFFARTSFTRALKENAGQVLKRLAGESANAPPVLSLVTQFGGGKTHTLTTLYHLARMGDAARADPGVSTLAAEAFLPSIPQAKVGVFVGNAWDPQPGHETPWIDLARQLAGDEGVGLLGLAATTTPPGTDTLLRLFHAADGPVLLLFDEVLNFINRHRGQADAFYAFIQNLTVAMTGTTKAALVISLPRSQVEMTDWDMQWQDRITKVVRRVATDLVANDETEIADVVLRRLFEERGSVQTRRNVARAYAEWCFANRAQLPPEWTAADTARSDEEVRESLTKRFESAYPFHPATLSVFHRKWSTTQQFQATRGTLAMLAQWVSLVYREGFMMLRNEPLIALGSAPLHSPDFLGVVLGQLGESRLQVGVSADIAGENAHARALDVDTKDALKDIHRRVGTAIFFESSGGIMSQVAHLPELRFAVGGPNLDTTTVDNAAFALENRAFYLRQTGTDGYKVTYKPTLKKVVSERRSSLDYQTDILPGMQKLVRESFESGRTLPITFYPRDDNAVEDSPQLSLVVMDPAIEWNDETRARIAQWTRQRGQMSRFYPGALVWCVRQPGTRLRSEVQDWLAWKRVQKEVQDGLLGGELTPGEVQDVNQSLREQAKEAQNEVWASYRFLALYDNAESDSLRLIDLGSGHASSGETLTGRMIAALKSSSLLNESVGIGYIDRSWPPALLQVAAWPLKSLRQSFLNGALTRLLDPDSVLKSQIQKFVGDGSAGLASGLRTDGRYEHLWFKQDVSLDEIAFESDVYLLKQEKAAALKQAEAAPPPVVTSTESTGDTTGTTKDDESDTGPSVDGDKEQVAIQPAPSNMPVALKLQGKVPADSWNRLGTKLIPKIRMEQELSIDITINVSVDGNRAQSLREELKQVLEDMQLTDKITITPSGSV